MPRVHLPALVAGAIALFVLAAPRDAHAVTVSVAPNDTTVDLGNVLSVRVLTGAVSNLKAYRLQFGFDPAVLQFQGAVAGEVLTSSGNPFTIQVVADAAAPTDTAHVDCAQLVGTASGPGVLVYLQFKAVGFGDSPIACDGADFRDPLNVSTLPGCAPGVVHVVHPTPGLPASWGRLKGAYR
jgi:hypothetical protein